MIKTYKFKSNGQIEEDCEHEVEYYEGCILQIILLWRLVNVYNVVMDKLTLKKYCEELGDYVEEQYKLNQNGKNIRNHSSSIDMSAELLTEFLDLKFNEIK